jgi:hypothetical protein
MCTNHFNQHRIFYTVTSGTVNESWSASVANVSECKRWWEDNCRKTSMCSHVIQCNLTFSLSSPSEILVTELDQSKATT